MTATATPTLEQAMAERTLEYLDSASLTDLRVGLHELANCAIGQYSVWDEERTMGERLAAGYLAAFEDELIRVALEEVKRSVVPAVAKAAAAYLGQNPPPAHLVAHKDSAQLRADLEASR